MGEQLSESNQRGSDIFCPFSALHFLLGYGCLARDAYHLFSVALKGLLKL